MAITYLDCTCGFGCVITGTVSNDNKRSAYSCIIEGIKEGRVTIQGLNKVCLMFKVLMLMSQVVQILLIR